MLGAQASPYLQPGEWQASGSYRHFTSDRHFTGTREDVRRTEEGSQDINTVDLFDIELTRVLSRRLSVSMGLPYLIAERSTPIWSLDRTQVVGRNRTGARGIGDMSISARAWLLDPARFVSGNVSLGLGLKLPTGANNVHDSFRGLDGTIEVRTVDPSIQPGDGGFGLVISAAAFRRVSMASLYATGTYLINPRATNGVATYRSSPSEAFTSVPDQYIVRAGGFVALPQVPGLSFGLGGRIEGTRAQDLIGGDDGFRRAGYSLAVEPAASFAWKQWVVSASVPIAVRRNRVVSGASEMGQDDAAFADYTINLGVSYRFGGASRTPAQAAKPASSTAPAAESHTAAALDVLPGGLVAMDGRPAMLRLGTRLTVVNLWASWCKPCAHEVPMLARLGAELQPAGVHFIGVSVDESLDSARAGADALGFTFPVFFGGLDFLDACQESRVPTTFILDRDGRVVDRIAGQVSEQTLRDKIAAILGEPLPAGKPPVPAQAPVMPMPADAEPIKPAE